MQETDPVIITHSNRFLGLTKNGFMAGIAAILLACLITLGVFLAYEVGQNRKLALRGAQAQIAWCALESNIASRIPDEQATLARSKKFLLEHPDGIPGIPAALIRQGIATQQRTITGQESTILVISKAIPCPKGK